MFQKKPSGLREAIAAVMICGALGATPAVAQTAFGSSKTIVFPVLANTVTFTSTVTLYNPNGSDVTVGLDFFDANNTAVPGPKPCSDILVPANGTVAFTLASQCTLDPTTSHFGPLIASDNAGTSEIFGYSRTENNASAGFSIEGFPSENFATDTTNVTGLRGSTNVAPTHQSNCFVTAQADAITYDMNLFDGTTGAQIGSTVSGVLNPFEQFRYLDVFSPTVANAPAATDFSNVRAEFTRTSVGTQQMVAFCTVQDNATFGADFRIAKAVTPPPPPPPPPPVGELVLAGTWNGTISSLLVGSPRAFVGSTAVVLASAGSISAYGGGWFARNSSGGAGSLSLGVCYQDQSGPGPITVLGSTTTYSVSGSQTWHYAAGTAALPAGTYNVGLCAQNIGSNALNKNGNTSGFVFVGS
ncbi:MAG TPA: hypothetical protein VL856_11050 [Acidimicrobiia bacterium]|nr:hypothetical protein [Acidimicrobiia bacterium]